MWISPFSALILPVLAAANVFHIAAPPVDFLVTVTVKSPSATAASVPTLSTLVPTTVSTKGVESFELKPRQGGAPINPDPNGNPNAVPVQGVNPGPVIPPAAPPIPVVVPPPPAIPGVVPDVVPDVAAPTTPTTTPISQLVTVQWVETKLGSTSRTWIPKTITINFDTSPSKAPEPGKGVIGMGTLTGETGKTKTIVVGAAPTGRVGKWRAGMVAAGVAVMGAVV